MENCWINLVIKTLLKANTIFFFDDVNTLKYVITVWTGFRDLQVYIKQDYNNVWTELHWDERKIWLMYSMKGQLGFNLANFIMGRLLCTNVICKLRCFFLYIAEWGAFDLWLYLISVTSFKRWKFFIPRLRGLFEYFVVCWHCWVSALPLFCRLHCGMNTIQYSLNNYQSLNGTLKLLLSGIKSVLCLQRHMVYVVSVCRKTAKSKQTANCVKTSPHNVPQ